MTPPRTARAVDDARPDRADATADASQDAPGLDAAAPAAPARKKAAARPAAKAGAKPAVKAAGKAGKFGYVVGVNRADQRDALKDNGADVVVDDLSELL